MGNKTPMIGLEFFFKLFLCLLYNHTETRLCVLAESLIANTCACLCAICKFSFRRV